MTAQDNQGRLPTDTETPQTPATRDISLRVSCLQTQQLISQFPFFSFISLISVVTIGILYGRIVPYICQPLKFGSVYHSPVSRAVFF